MIFKKWVDVQFDDFIEDVELTNRLLGFIDNHLIHGEGDLRKTAGND